MMVLLSLDVISRFAGKPIQGMAPLSVFVMMIVVYLGMARCEEYGENVNLTIIKDKFSPSNQLIIEKVSYLLTFVTVVIFFSAVLLDSIKSYKSNEAIASTVELPIWPTKFIMFIGLFFFLLQTIVKLIDSIKKGKNQ
jgi:TRAP-type C4-dicarboxylate transport system permease small subunit